MRGFYFITDAALSRGGIISDASNAVAAKVRTVQYRAKNVCSRQMFEEASKLRKICAKTTFLINDRVDIVLAVGADGVHLGQDDLSCVQSRKILGKGKIIGITVHNLKEAITAEDQGADYLSISPIFTTQTKADAGIGTGVELIREIKKRVFLPVVAIGGITLNNAPAVIASGADAICAISAVVTAKNVKAEIEKFQGLFKY